MNDFERGISQATRIYKAGISGAAVPYFAGMRVADIEQLYSAGYMAHWEALDKETELLPHIERFISRALRGDPKLAADLAAYRAAIAHK